MNKEKPTARAVLINTNSGMSAGDIDELERRFFNQLVMANGTLKTTSVNRLPDVDSACGSLLANRNSSVRLLDVGISSGVTTHEWITTLNKQQVDFTMDAFDLTMDASIVSFSDNFHVLLDSSQRVLQFEFYGRAEANFLGESIARMTRRALPLLTLRLVFAICRRALARRARSIKVKLVSHRLKEAPNVRVFEYDLSNIDKLTGKYDLIRAANILNLAYFDKAFLSKTISKIKAKLADDGLFCVVRTNSTGVNNGTIYRLSNGSLVPIRRFGDGSEIDPLVT